MASDQERRDKEAGQSEEHIDADPTTLCDREVRVHQNDQADGEFPDPSQRRRSAQSASRRPLAAHAESPSRVSGGGNTDVADPALLLPPMEKLPQVASARFLISCERASGIGEAACDASAGPPSDTTLRGMGVSLPVGLAGDE